MTTLRDIKQRIAGVQKTQTTKKDLDQDLQAGLMAACQDFKGSFQV